MWTRDIFSTLVKINRKKNRDYNLSTGFFTLSLAGIVWTCLILCGLQVCRTEIILRRWEIFQMIFWSFLHRRPADKKDFWNSENNSECVRNRYFSLNRILWRDIVSWFLLSLTADSFLGKMKKLQQKMFFFLKQKNLWPTETNWFILTKKNWNSFESNWILLKNHKNYKTNKNNWGKNELTTHVVVVKYYFMRHFFNGCTNYDRSSETDPRSGNISNYSNFKSHHSLKYLFHWNQFRIYRLRKFNI